MNDITPSWDHGYQSGYRDAVKDAPTQPQHNATPEPRTTLLTTLHYPDGTHKTVKLPDDNTSYAAIREYRAAGAIVYVTRIRTEITPDAL